MFRPGIGNPISHLFLVHLPSLNETKRGDELNDDQRRGVIFQWGARGSAWAADTGVVDKSPDDHSPTSRAYVYPVSRFGAYRAHHLR